MSRSIDAYRGRVGVEPICRALDVSTSAYYHRAAAAPSDGVVEDARLLSVIVRPHAVNYEAYGYRKMWKALGWAGEQVGRDHVRRLMRQHGVQGAKRRGKQWRTTTPDLYAAGPNRARLHRPGAPTGCTSRTSPAHLAGQGVLQLRHRRVLLDLPQNCGDMRYEE